MEKGISTLTKLKHQTQDQELLLQENLAQNELLQALVVEEDFWREKTRVNWQVGGDRNTSFFHKVTKITQASKALSTLRDDKIIAKLATWKCNSLSIMVRVELVKYIRNFIWSGDTRTRKLVIVAWKTVCTSLKARGLGLKSIKHMNHAALLKLSWEMISSQHEWALFCRLRFGREASPSPRYYKSSIWHGIKVNWWVMVLRSVSGRTTGLTLLDFVNHSTWTFPQVIAEAYPHVVDDIVKLHIFNTEDKLIWMGTNDGVLSLRDAFLCIKQKAFEQHWCKVVWSASIPHQNHSQLGGFFTTKCQLMRTSNKEVVIWLLGAVFATLRQRLQPTYSRPAPLWLCFGISLVICFKFTSIQAQLTPFYQPAMVIGAPRNQRRFEDKAVSLLQAKAKIKLTTTLSGNHSKLLTNNSVHNFIILREFNVKPNFLRAPRIKEVVWIAYSMSWIKINSDGAAHGALGCNTLDFKYQPWESRLSEIIVA
ncbi:hypothetical protein Lal_00013539 [Lupinus albus]|nr:hypothetical protein Lal_00013539 [Lupinus albus]